MILNLCLSLKYHFHSITKLLFLHFYLNTLLKLRIEIKDHLRHIPNLKHFYFKEALNLFTKSAAIAEFSENNRGMIELGYEADLSILSNDIMTIESEKILKTDVIATVVNGQIVYGGKNF